MTNQGEGLLYNDKTPQNVILNAVKNPAYSLDESCLKGDKIFTTQTFTNIAEILPRPKSAFRMTNQDNCPNPTLTKP